MVSVLAVSCHHYYTFPSVCLSTSASMAEEAALTGAWLDGVRVSPAHPRTVEEWKENFISLGGGSYTGWQ